MTSARPTASRALVLPARLPCCRVFCFPHVRPRVSGRYTVKATFNTLSGLVACFDQNVRMIARDERQFDKEYASRQKNAKKGKQVGSPALLTPLALCARTRTHAHACAHVQQSRSSAAVAGRTPRVCCAEDCGRPARHAPCACNRRFGKVDMGGETIRSHVKTLEMHMRARISNVLI